MPEHVELERVKHKGMQIILVGTAHISDKSIELVRETIAKEKPDVVGVELDSQRYTQLKSGRKWQEMNLFSVVRSGKTYLLLVNLLLSSIQRRFGESVGVKPGSEMLAAIDAAEKAHARVFLLDRDITITMKRAMASMGFLEKLKLFFGVLMSFFGFGETVDAEKVEELKNKDLLTELMGELSREMPGTKKALVDERDLFIANRILSSGAKKIVAVVGLGHLHGIKRFLDRKRDISELLTVPGKRNYLSLVKYLVPALFVAMVVLAYYLKGSEYVLDLFVVWIAVNSFFSALGALLARAHWKSILAALVSAPITSLHPALAAGWVAGLVELRVRCPRVRDFESLNRLEKLSDFYKNRVTHILLVAAFTNAGSIIGTFIALSIAASMFQ